MVSYKKRTREEIISWINRAIDRKERREKEIREAWNLRQQMKKAALDSHYYDLEWN